MVTLDADIAVPRSLAVQREDIRQRLISSGFTEEFLGTDQPPATHYRLGDVASGFYVEFLTPLAGGRYDPSKRRKSTLLVSGVTSQQLARQIPARRLTALPESSRALFGELSDDIRRAALISDERKLSPEAIREACSYGLEQLLS